LLTHAPLAHHAAYQLQGFLEIVLRASCHISQSEFLCASTAQGHRQPLSQVGARYVSQEKLCYNLLAYLV
jgi:hypothetical protein